MAKKSIFTIDELVSQLQRSQLPTILVEGNDDIIIYRQIEKKLGIGKVDFLPCGGRNTLLKLFERREEFKELKVFFIADKDMWVFLPVPIVYQNIQFTSGYSIENDLYYDANNRLDELLDSDELVGKKEVLDNLVQWFAFEVEKYLNNPQETNFSDISLLSPKIMERTNNKFMQTFLEDRGFLEPNESTISKLKENNFLKLRGKFIFQVYTRIFEIRKEQKRDIVTYTKEQLFDLCYRESTKCNSDTIINNLIKSIITFFDIK
ncbi:MAG: hypothetical protein EAZ95_11550 [Bacteroidetes bacterium]|nr:MAG: hypothetical protein EAZ95_11550 [Bacteroidota bacterium]